MNTEMLEGLGASPMQAFREASKLYRHLFFSFFRQEMNTCHPRGEALAYLWFSLDKFLEQVGHCRSHCPPLAFTGSKTTANAFTWALLPLAGLRSGPNPPSQLNARGVEARGGALPFGPCACACLCYK